MRPTVIPYDPRWPQQFGVVHTELTRAVAGIDGIGIEHVGSTSVPGLAAKPVLDIDVVVGRAELASSIAALGAAGYRHRGKLGIEDRHAFDAPADGIDRHVYVVVAGSIAHRNHIGARDVLRSDTTLRNEYAALKLRLAERDHDTIDDYVDAKTALLLQVLERAGLDEGDRDAVERANRAG